MKRPAAAETDDDDEAVQDTRDRNKMNYFNKHKDGLPAEMMEMWTREGRKGQTKLINNLVKRNADGEFVFDLDNPYVEDARHAYAVMFLRIALCSFMA